MPLVRCPACDGRIATVAAKCPHCSYALAEERRRTTGVDEIACHRCRATIPSDLPVCCNCGVISPRPHRPLITGRRSAVVAVLLLVVGAGWARFEPLALASALPSGTETVVMPAQISTPTVQIPVLRDVEIRWTSTWVNVRESRTLNSPVVQVLNPGVEVEVGNKEGAWWEARVDGHVVGYLSNAVLSLRPPQVE